MGEYWTAGEFARRSGVSVRTVQFYDQRHLLEPSAKGPQNQRLYSEADECRLKRILVLKFLGNSLSDIREILSSEEMEAGEMGALIDRQAELLGQDLARLMRRMAALQALRAQVGDGARPDWAGMAGSIDPAGARPSGMRHSMHPAPASPEGDAGGATPGGPGPGDLAQWRSVIAEALGLMAAGVPPEDEWARGVALRYLGLCDRLGRHSPSEFVPLDGGECVARLARGDDGADGDAGGSPYPRGSIDELRRSVDDYLASATAAADATGGPRDGEGPSAR